MPVYDCVSIVFLLRLCLFVPTDSINFKLKTFRYILLNRLKCNPEQMEAYYWIMKRKKIRRFQQTDIIIDFIYVQHI